MAKNTADSWKLALRFPITGNSYYCKERASDDYSCSKLSTFQELKKICKGDPSAQFCTFHYSDGTPVAKTDLTIIYYINLQRYLYSLGLDINDNSDRVSEAKQHFLRIIEEAKDDRMRIGYILGSLYSAMGDIKYIPNRSLRRTLYKLYDADHPIRFTETVSDCAPCQSLADVYEIKDFGVFHDRFSAVVCYNGKYLQMYRSFSGCLWHLVIHRRGQFGKHDDSYTTGLIMDMQLQKMLAEYQRKQVTPLKSVCHASFDYPKELLNNNTPGSRELLQNIEHFGVCGEYNNVRVSQLATFASKNNISSAMLPEGPQSSVSIAYIKRGKFAFITINDQTEVKRHIYPQSILSWLPQKMRIETVEIAHVRNNPVISYSETPNFILLQDIGVVLNNEFSPYGSPYVMLKILINYELPEMFECNLRNSTPLYTDFMTVEINARWERIFFKMHRVELTGKTYKGKQYPNLWLFYIEYNFPGRIVLPCFVQPLDLKLYPIYRVYESVIPGGFWLCKPFEYKAQSREYNLFEAGNYYHIGNEMNGLWPFID